MGGLLMALARKNMTTTTAYKVFTHNLRSPLQGGDPVWDGSLPFTLPTVDVDSSDKECGAGWNACRELHIALQIASLWPNGRPSRLFKIETDSDVIERGNKIRSSTWTITEEITDLRPAIERLSEPFECPGIVEEQLLWRDALRRPERDPRAVQEGLRIALEIRGLGDWTLKEFKHPQDARDAWTAWAAWTSWDARDAWTAWNARDASAARVAWSARTAWAARDAWAARAARDARDAWDAWDALTVFVAGTKGWTEQNPHLLTTGLRDAYRSGLGVTMSTGPNELGWAMAEQD